LNGKGSAARFKNPESIVTDSSGNLYVLEAGNGTLRKILPDGEVTTLATGFIEPRGLAIDTMGWLYVADRYAIQKVSPEGVASPWVGNAAVRGTEDGQGADARFNEMRGLTSDPSGNIYVCDTIKSTIRQITPAGEVTTIGGNAGVLGGADGLGVAGQFAYPWNLVATATGRLYVSDYLNNRIVMGVRRLPPEIIASPVSKTVALGASATFSVTAGGTGPWTYQWRKNGANIPKATAATYAIAAVKSSDAGEYDVVVKNEFGAALSAAVTLSLTPVVNITAMPQPAASGPGLPVTFIVTAPDATSFQWQKNGTPIKGATGAALTLPAVTAADAGLYSVVVAAPGGKTTTPDVMLTLADSGLLVYKLTGTGTAHVRTAASTGAVAGFLVVDRAGQRGGFVWSAKNGSVNTHWTEVRETLRIHSTGPIPKSRSVISDVVETGVAPDAERHLLWLAGVDALVRISASDQTVAPQTLAGSLQSLELIPGVRLEIISLRLTLDTTHSAAARLGGETLELALERLAKALAGKGSVGLD
jgi:hypothetical protein